MNWPSLDAGELRHQVNILRPVASFDASGSTVVMQPFLTGIYAKIEPVRGIDVIRSGQITTQLFLTVTVWRNAAILPTMQVQTLNGTYVIQSIENLLDLNQVMKLNCLALGENE